jgi:transposase InsO family protein
LCRFWKVSRAAFYKGGARDLARQGKEDSILNAVKQIRCEQPKLGTRKLFHELRVHLAECGRGYGRDKFFTLLRNQNLLIKRKRKYAVTTNSRHPFYRYGNELADQVITGPNKAWVSDITYLETEKGFAYLSLITDAYSRKIIGSHVDKSLGVEGTIKALNIALKQCNDTNGVIHHSDRGIQYCCKPYTKRLLDKGIKISMGEAGNCYDNAIAERVNGILKGEYMLDSRFKDIDHAVKATKQAVYLYNYKRPHWSLKFKKPAEVHDKIIK